MRGEDTRPANAMKVIYGSPPHARGRQVNELATRLEKRITPACAGKTDPKSGNLVFLPDHPRMRGEDVVRDIISYPAEGITPACAGKTACAVGERDCSGDHPRMRGEDDA